MNDKLIKCPTCHKEYDKARVVCFHCGSINFIIKKKKEAKSNKLLKALLIIAFTLVTLTMILVKLVELAETMEVDPEPQKAFSTNEKEKIKIVLTAEEKEIKRLNTISYDNREFVYDHDFENKNVNSDFANLEDRYQETCTQLYPDKNDFNACVAGKKDLFVLKKKHPQKYKICYESYSDSVERYEDGVIFTNPVTMCFLTWTVADPPRWWLSSTSSFSEHKTSTLMGCIRLNGKNMQKFNKCYKEMIAIR